MNTHSVITLFTFTVLLTSACSSSVKNQDLQTTDQQTPSRPNILFAISDDQSHVHTSYAGCQFINTPAFDRVAREGVNFEHCYAGSPGCAPSRSSIVTGRYHWQNEQSGQHASSWMKKHVPFIDELEANGYSIGRTGKGVSPFQYARSEADSLWRNTDAGGIEHSRLQYKPESNLPPTKGISRTNYFANFKYFMDNKKNNEAFFFWYGAREPHRKFEQDSWQRTDKALGESVVPGFLPDHEIVQGDMLDYAVEIEWFDNHLEQMLNYLESIGELDHTIVIVTSDNGMAFPRAKANCYEYGSHVPFAVRYPKEFEGGRSIKSPVSFIDIAPTLLDITDITPTAMLPMSGQSLKGVLEGKQSTPTRDFALSGRERHSSSRYLNRGYPQRMIRHDSFIYIWNMKPERWPAGAPQKFNPTDSTDLMPMYGLDDQGKYLPQASFTDIDDCPTKQYTIEQRQKESYYFSLAHDKRPEKELYNVVSDPFCLMNLATNASKSEIMGTLQSLLLSELFRTEDPRVVGPDTEVFDSYLRYSKMRSFPEGG